MTILVLEEPEEAQSWKQALERQLPGVEVRLALDEGDPSNIEMVILWDELDALIAMPRLKAAVILGAGVDHLLDQSSTIPAGVHVVRLVDPSLTSQMLEWVALSVLAHNRAWDEYRDLQRQGRYEELSVPLAAERTVGILGLGVLGRAAGELLYSIGYHVEGWSRSPKEIDGIACHHGDTGLRKLLAGADIVVCMLPLTGDTENLFNAETFALMKAGSYFINAARGGHVVEEDLIAAIDSGRLSGATLDVQRTEPLPQDHPFWTHPKIKITPHIATFTYARSCAGQVAENYRRLAAGEPLLNVVDMTRQY